MCVGESEHLSNKVKQGSNRGALSRETNALQCHSLRCAVKRTIGSQPRRGAKRRDPGSNPGSQMRVAQLVEPSFWFATTVVQAVPTSSSVSLRF